MAEVLGDQWPVGVCFFVGQDPTVKGLAKQMDKDIREVLTKENADLDILLGKPIHHDIEALASAIETDKWSILQIVTHGNQRGDTEVTDVWGDLPVGRERLSALVRGHKVRLALVLSCYGAKVAQQLVEDGSVDVAVGMESPMDFSVALAFSKGFHLAIARGQTIRRAFSNGLNRAALRPEDFPDDLHIYSQRDSGAADLPMCDPAEFFVMGKPSDPKAIRKLMKALGSHTGFHVDVSFFDPDGPAYVGLAREKVLLRRFNAAKVVMLLFEGERQEDATIAELVTRAVHRAEQGDVRFFAVYLEGTTPNPNVPFGMMRLVPAYLEHFGSYKKLGKYLGRLFD